jgi:hypothetical protein
MVWMMIRTVNDHSNGIRQWVRDHLRRRKRDWGTKSEEKEKEFSDLHHPSLHSRRHLNWQLREMPPKRWRGNCFLQELGDETMKDVNQEGTGRGS